MFNRRDSNTNDQASRETTPEPTSAQATESIIAQEDTFEGEVKTITGVRVLGTVRGTIESQRSVRIESGAVVEADIMADEVVIAGRFSGSLICRNRVEITATGHVTGKVETQKLQLNEGGFFNGELRMQNASDVAKPSEDDAARPRRQRYVDLATESARPAEKEEAVEVGKTEE